MWTACYAHEAISYQGRYYRLDDAPLHPQPVQQPRPPLTLAAQGRHALKLAAEYADRWVVLGEPGMPESESLAAIRRRSAEIDEHCHRIGRDPGAISRAILAGYAGEALFASMDAFHGYIDRYQAVGIDTFIFFLFSEPLGQYDAYRRLHSVGCIADREILARVAAAAIPGMRRAATGG